MTHKCTVFLHNTCRLGRSQRFKAGDQMRSFPELGCGLYNRCPLGSTQHFKAGNKIGTTSALVGYITPATRGIPNPSERVTKSEVTHKLAGWLHDSCHVAGPQRLRAGGKSEVAHKCARFLHNPCRIRGPRRFMGDRKSGLTHKWARWPHSACLMGGPQKVESGGQNQK